MIQIIQSAFYIYLYSLHQSSKHFGYLNWAIKNGKLDCSSETLQYCCTDHYLLTRLMHSIPVLTNNCKPLLFYICFLQWIEAIISSEMEMEIRNKIIVIICMLYVWFIYGLLSLQNNEKMMRVHRYIHLIKWVTKKRKKALHAFLRPSFG